MTTTYRKTKSPAAAHCDLCSQTIDGDTPDGYTTCCNELICSGGACITLRITTDPGTGPHTATRTSLPQ